ncbi:hypothetical protein CXB51_010591 [Gossypium anomalum]|uniref:RING-CH-type domain-containing protein n=1 Tax=Gossypium anomalum TaxID=47600 RepID=A0A8J5Z186_9ROSI|nr:hypothetical protein CXB51_010591 [Gossypium anomalum]
MEGLPKQSQGVVIDIDGEEEEQANQTDNREQEGRCSSSCSSTDEESGTTEIIKERESSMSHELDLESGVTETKLHLAKMETDCRICHLSLDPNNQESGVPIELGCSCKDDLAAAHKHCAEAWFKIKGNRTCEICGSVAQNVAAANEMDTVELWNEANDSTATAAPVAIQAAETRNFWRGHRFLNFLLAFSGHEPDSTSVHLPSTPCSYNLRANANSNSPVATDICSMVSILVPLSFAIVTIDSHKKKSLSNTCNSHLNCSICTLQSSYALMIGSS